MYRVVVVLGVVGDYAKFGLLSYISRGKQPRIHQLAQYHSNNTELSSSDTFATDFNIRAAAGTKSETHCKSCRHLENIKKLSNRKHQHYS